MDPNEEQAPEPTLPSAEQMRARRLMMMERAQAAAAASAAADGASADPTPAPQTTSRTTPITTRPPPSTSSTPSSATRKPSTTATPSPASVPAASKPKPTPTISPEQALADWTHTTISNLLRVTLISDPVQKNHHGHILSYLPELHAEIVESRGGAQPRLEADDIDGALREACATKVPTSKPLLSYLLPVYKAIVHASKLRTLAPERLQVLQELKRLCMSNIVFALTMPEYFGREPNDAHDSIVPGLLLGVSSPNPNSIDMDFLTDAVSRFDDDEEGLFQGVFVKAMVQISNKLSTMSMNDQYLPYVEALLTYTRFKPLLVAVANHPSFHMAQSAANIEKFTILGPFFRLSPMQPDVSKSYFGGHRKTELQRKESVYSAVQMIANTHQASLHEIAMAFARAGDGPRNKLLDWFAYIMNVNHKRRAMQVNSKEVSSDGFMMNVGSVLDRMCEPFMEANFARMERIEVDYLRRKPRVDIKDETKLNADQAESDEFYANVAAGESKFVSELFFLNVASHHYGMGAAAQKFKDIDRELKHMESQAAELEQMYEKYLGQGMSGQPMATLQRNIKLYDEAIDRYVSYKYSMEAALLDEKMQQRALMFTRLVSVWILRLASGTDYVPDKQFDLPLSETQPQAFSCLPEYVLQIVVDQYKFLFRHLPRILPSAVGEEAVTLCVTFLESSSYIRNPYIKSSLVSLLFMGTWRVYHLSSGVLGDLLSNGKIANKYLLHSLMKFYNECESTGAHTQFYDKFNIRYEIFQVIKMVWPNDLYKRQLTQQSRTNRDFFVQFVNLLLNDATFVLDEALSRFPKIHELEKDLDEGSESLTPEERQQKEQELEAAESQATSYMQLANETVAMMRLFTATLAEAFTMPEIVNRLAGMLDYNLVVLAGPTSRNLKVKSPEKYHFSPKVLLPQIVELFLNLGVKDAFVEGVAADGRSYKPQVFEDATRILSNRALLEPVKLETWKALNVKFAAAKAVLDQAEMDLGEVPSEFEDPIMGDLMKDPVVLPSKHVVDRSTIVQHLLSDPKDPFTRQPMTVADVVPDTELKAKIDAWRAERIAAAKEANQAASAAADAGNDPDAMDVN